MKSWKMWNKSKEAHVEWLPDIHQSDGFLKAFGRFPTLLRLQEIRMLSIVAVLHQGTDTR